MMKKTKVVLKGLQFYAQHGVLKEEAKLGQRFTLDVTLVLREGLDFADDQPEATVDYAEVYHAIKEVFTSNRFHLIERCAEVVASEMIARFDKVIEATVKVKKPAAPVDCICDFFAVEVTRCR